MQYEVNNNPKPGIVFLFSLVPGAGHMYMGLMTRGLQLLVGFMLGFALIGFTYNFNFIIGPAMVVLYIFNLFDAYNCRKRIQAGVEVADETIVKVGGVYVGIGLIVLGGLGLLFTLDNLSHMADLFYDIVGNAIRLLPSLVLLAIGLVLLGRGRKKDRKEEDKENGEAA